MMEDKEKQCIEEDHKRYLLQVAGHVEQMLVSERRIRERFVQQVRLCEQKYNDYYRWLDTQYKAAKKNPWLLDENAGKSPKKGYIFDSAGCYWRKPDREDLPDITVWFYPLSGVIKTSRMPKDEECLMRSYVLLAVVHDNVLQDSQVAPVYFMPREKNRTGFQSWANQNIWKWMSILTLYAAQNRYKVSKEINIMLNAALTSVLNDPANFEATDTDSQQGRIGFLAELTPEEPSE